jgi:UDP-glucose 4-epimerase
LILVTGGAGFIGLDTCIALTAAGIPYLVLDNFCNSRRSVLERIGRITGIVPRYIEGDIRNARLRQFEGQLVDFYGAHVKTLHYRLV